MENLRWNMMADLFQAAVDRPHDHRFAGHLDTGTLAELVRRVAAYPPAAARRLSIKVDGRDRMLTQEIMNLARRPDFPNE